MQNRLDPGGDFRQEVNGEAIEVTLVRKACGRRQGRAGWRVGANGKNS